MFIDFGPSMITAIITAACSLVLGVLAHQRAKRESDNNSLDAHLTALREMYKELVDDLRSEVDRLQEENRKLRNTVKQLSAQLREMEKRERNLKARLEAAEFKLSEMDK